MLALLCTMLCGAGHAVTDGVLAETLARFNTVAHAPLPADDPYEDGEQDSLLIRDPATTGDNDSGSAPIPPVEHVLEHDVGGVGAFHWRAVLVLGG